jgi:hypothetical protein
MPLTSPNWLDRVSKGGMTFFPMLVKPGNYTTFTIGCDSCGTTEPQIGLAYLVGS